MSINITISITIVAYRKNIDGLSNLIESLHKIQLPKKIFLIDNSPDHQYKDKFDPQEVDYVASDKNIGFAAGNNLVIPKIENQSEYHLVLNPDVKMEPEVIIGLVNEMEKNKEIGVIAPGVKYPDGKHQYTCRRYPTLVELIQRFLKLSTKRVRYGNYLDMDLTKPLYVDVLHGCFLLFRTENFVEINGFDTRYFLYMEDIDICRKIDAIPKKKLYFPQYTIYHEFRKQSSKNLLLFLIHLTSILKYFNKWS